MSELKVISGPWMKDENNGPSLDLFLKLCGGNYYTQEREN
jgi:hypothetical protein